MSLNWQLNRDGSFSLQGPSLVLHNAYPAFDQAPIRPLRVDMQQDGNGGRIEYELGEGRLVLQLRVAENVAVLAATLHDVARAPHQVWPLGHARLEGASRYFQQGLGFGGPSGWSDFAGLRAPQKTEAGSAPSWFRESYLVTGLANEESTLTVAAYDHQRFLQKSTLRSHQSRRGLINRHLDEEMVYLEAGFSIEGISIGSTLVLPELHFRQGSDAWQTFRDTAAAIGQVMQTRTQHAPRYHWCSWYAGGCNFTHDDLQNVLEGLDTLEPKVPLQTIQIDDGYCASPGDWLIPRAIWPGGLQEAFHTIRERGYKAGVWIAPFMVGNRSKLFHDHPEWMLRDVNGNLIAEWKNYDASGIPSHIDEETYVLDTSHPEAMQYLREVFRAMKSSGATFYKTDFMDWGLRDSLSVRRHTPGKTSVEYFREVLQMIRDEIGEESYWLACISPFAPFLGFADGMRVANDTGPGWSSGSAGNMLQEMTAGQYFNGVWWQNDPDVVMLRDHFIHLSESEVQTLALFCGLMGGSVNTSDWLHQLPPHRLQMWRRLQPGPSNNMAQLPFWNRPQRLLCVVREFPEHQAFAVQFVNPHDQPVTQRFALAELVKTDSAFAWQWNMEGSTVLGEINVVVPEVESHGHALYWLASQAAAPPGDWQMSGID
jgi:hypothetical protein